MAETYRALYGNMAWRTWTTAITSNVSDSHNAAGFRVPQAFDGDRLSQWVIDTAHGNDIWAKIDRGAEQTAETGIDGIGIGVINHNLESADCTSIVLEYSTNDVSWVSLFETNTVPADSDLIYVRTTAATYPTARYLRVRFEFNGGGSSPTTDVQIGQIYVGKYVSLDSQPDSNVSTPLTFGTSFAETEGGGFVTQSKGYRTEQLNLAWTTVGSAFRSDMLTVFGSQNGGARPLCLHTHRHTTGSDAWTTSALGSLVDGRGGVYWVTLSQEDIGQIEHTDSTFDLSIPLRRIMGATQT